jgi:hypothetical protein
MTHARLVLGALAAAALATAGCGSSPDDGGKAAAPAKTTPIASAQPASGPTKETYVRRADALCRDARDIGQRANAAVRKAFVAKQGKKAAAAIDRYIPAYEAKVEQLKGLPRPEADDRVLNAFMKVMDGQVVTLKAESRALRENDVKMMKRISGAQSQALEFADTLAQGIGFQVCGRAA